MDRQLVLFIRRLVARSKLGLGVQANLPEPCDDHFAALRNVKQ